MRPIDPSAVSRRNGVRTRHRRTVIVTPWAADAHASRRLSAPMLLAIAEDTPMPRPFPIPMRIEYIG